jgi:hypothetical protein
VGRTEPRLKGKEKVVSVQMKGHLMVDKLLKEFTGNWKE